MLPAAKDVVPFAVRFVIEIDGVPVSPAAVPLVLAALFGMSPDTRARNVGFAAAPVIGPAQIVFAVCVESVNVNAGVVVGLATAAVAIESKLAALKLVTVPDPARAAILPAEIEKFTPARSIGSRSPLCAGFPGVSWDILRFAI